MKLDEKLLEILCCPESKQALKRIDAARLKALNECFANGRLLFRDGTAVQEPMDDGLITEDGQTIYPVFDGIPVLLIEQAIATDQLN